MHMANFTISISDELLSKMRSFPQINWSAAIRSVIEKTVDDFEEFERLTSKSKFTQKDADELSAKVDRAAGLQARKLLNEARRGR